MGYQVVLSHKCEARVVHIPKQSHEASTDWLSSECVEPNGNTLGQTTLFSLGVYGAMFALPTTQGFKNQISNPHYTRQAQNSGSSHATMHMHHQTYSPLERVTIIALLSSEWLRCAAVNRAWIHPRRTAVIGHLSNYIITAYECWKLAG